MTVPATIALAIAATALPASLIDHLVGETGWSGRLGHDEARQIFVVVATAAMTALSLTYSLTLVVFTLAASSIGPRLLKRFTTERVNQVTAGLLGGTFIYALVALALTGYHPPRASAIGAVILAVASVVQLIWFVRNVAQSVSVDDEIAAITGRLTEDMMRLQKHRVSDVELPPDTAFWPAAAATDAGYVAGFDRQALCALAARADVVLRTELMAGEFVLAGRNVLSVCGPMEDDELAELRGLVQIEAARSDSRTVHFSINLLVEVALRALSPGVNDTFTAIAVTDKLSGAMADLAGLESGPEVIFEKSGKPRVVVLGAELPVLVDQAFRPLRVAAAENVLMSRGLARAFTRLYEAGGPTIQQTIMTHSRLLLEELRKSRLPAPDVDAIEQLLPTWRDGQRSD